MTEGVAHTYNSMCVYSKDIYPDKARLMNSWKKPELFTLTMITRVVARARHILGIIVGMQSWSLMRF